MAAPAGATHLVKPTVQAVQVPGALSDWQNLLCVCDMTTTPDINPGAQSFVAGLAADLSDLQMTDAVDAARPWRRHELGLFSQVEGSEKLYLEANAAAIAAEANTEFRCYRGCTGGTFEDAGSGVVSGSTEAFWSHEEAAPAALVDWSANGRDATRTDAVQVAGQIGKAQAFNGATAHFDVGAIGIAGSQNRMVAFWVKSTGMDNGDSFLGWGAGGSGGDTFAILNSEASRIYVAVYGGNRYWTATGLFDNAWHHLAFVLDGTNTSDLVAYMDGSPLPVYSTADVALATVDANFAIGERFGGYGSGYLHGVLDEITVLSAAWGANDIAAHHNMTSDPAAWCVCGAEEAVASLPALRSATRHRYPMIGLW